MDLQKSLRTMALAAATDFEVRQIKRALNSPQATGDALTVVPVGVACREISDDYFKSSCLGIVSIGFAGALDPALSPGACLAPRRIVTTDQTSYEVDPDLRQIIAACVPSGVTDTPLLHTARLLSSIKDKQHAYEQSNCSACDMESGILAELAQRLSIPFACLRVVLDPATAPLPYSIASFSNPGWTTADFLLSTVLRPRELPATVAILRHTATASRTLRRVTKELSTGLCID